MKAWLVALNTYRGLLRSRAILFLVLVFILTLLGYITGLYFATRLEDAGAAEQSRWLFARQIESLLTTYAFLAHAMALLAGVLVLPGEIKSGTIVPTLGRALPRGQYVLGLFLGLNLLLATYLAMAVVSIGTLMLWSGVRLDPNLLLGVPFLILSVNILMGVAFFYSTILNPLVAFIAAAFTLSLPGAAEIVRLYSQEWSERLRTALEYLLPAWDLLAYDNYLVITRSPEPREWTAHLLGMAHGLDYLALLLLLAYLTFRRRSLLPPA